MDGESPFPRRPPDAGTEQAGRPSVTVAAGTWPHALYSRSSQHPFPPPPVCSQECGQPPDDIVKELAPGMSFGPDGLPSIPAMPGPAGDGNCSVM